MEEILAQIAADLLKLDRVGVHDNFFDMGGHSLLATQFVARTYAALGKTLELSTVLRGATIAAIRESLRDVGDDAVRPPTRAVRGDHRRRPSFANSGSGSCSQFSRIPLRTMPRR